MGSKPKSLFFLVHYVGFLLLAALVWWSDPVKLGKVAASAGGLWLLAAFLLNIPQLGLKAFRWFLLVRWQGYTLSYPRAFLAYFGSLLVGFLTPGRLGEMAKAITLKYESGMTLAQGLSSVILDRAFDLYLLLSLGTLGILRFAVVGSVISWPAFALICLLVFLPLLFLNQKMILLLGTLMTRLPILRARERLLKEKSTQFAVGFSMMTPYRILICILLTFSSYSIFFLQCLLCVWALNFSVDFIDLVLLMAATNFISFIPISISGLGTREAALVFFFAQLNPALPGHLAVALGLALFLVLFIGGGFIGAFCWRLAPIGLQQALKDFKRI